VTVAEQKLREATCWDLFGALAPRNRRERRILYVYLRKQRRTRLKKVARDVHEASGK